MLTRTAMLAAALLLLATATLAAAPAATPFDGATAPTVPHGSISPAKDFGDPQDFAAGSLAAADYLRYMQADITEDNAGNGASDDDPDDGGWNWSTTIFEHDATASSVNLYGVTAQGLYQAYLIQEDPALFTAMLDAADHTVADGAANIRTAFDILFLLNFASLPGVADPTPYHTAAVAIWDSRIAQFGSAAGIAEGIRDIRAGQNYENGIIAWDVSPYAEAAMALHDLYPADGYDGDAVDIAEVLYQDSFALIPGYFDFDGRCRGHDPAYANTDYYWYTLGVQGLIKAFSVAGVHAGDIALLETRLFESQYDDGAFGYQYGAPADVNDRDWQATAYCLMTVDAHLADSAADHDAIFRAGSWLGATQDASGGFVYGSGTHYPEIGGECGAAQALAWRNSAASITTDIAGSDPSACGETHVATISYERSEGTPGLRGYEITFEVTGPATVSAIADAGGLGGAGLHQFYLVDNGDGTYTVSDALLGSTPGLLADAALFTVDILPTGDGDVELTLLSYKLRDPDNIDFYADLFGDGFAVDCTPPDAVDTITAAPGHEKVTVGWTKADETDVAAYEIYRGLWYYVTPDASVYPEYSDYALGVIPARPADRATAAASAEWVLVDTVPVGTFSLVDDQMTLRGCYYYEVFPIDGVDNGGAAAPDNDRALNYWLGDVDLNLDGYVNVADISLLGASFGLLDGDPGYNNETDVGPTDNGQADGIPMTDNEIDFEDLMIFALNFGNVGPAKQLPAVDTSVTLAWTPVSDTAWSLELVAGCTSLKGLRLRASLPEGVRCVATSGELLDAQADPVFLRQTGDLDLSLALLGVNKSLCGSGELLHLEFGVPFDPDGIAIDARALDNSRLSVETDATAPHLPTAFALAPNFPNPFNPSTTVAFDLPREADVRLTVHALDGSLVRTLVSRRVGAGSHTETWNGRDDAGLPVASGTYICRLQADDHGSSRKMLLMK